MKIVITLNSTDLLGGSVIWAYTVAEELINRGYDVYLQAYKKGRNHHRFLNLGVHDHKPNIYYDLIIGNHLSRFTELKGHEIVNVCHGTIVELEKPDHRADRYIAISQEVQHSLLDQGYESKVVLNPVNMNRFKPENRGKGFLSLCQGEEANEIIKIVCEEYRIPVTFHSKYNQPVWDLWNEINNHELIFSLGRGVYESWACDKPVIVMDSRGYTPAYGDGLLDGQTMSLSLYANCSGRGTKTPINVNNVKVWITEYLEYYKPKGYYRQMAENFDAVKIVDNILHD